MEQHDTQQACLNGHQITANYQRSPQFRKKFCATCGAATIQQCLSCKHNIRGEYHTDGVVIIGHITPVPTHCENCGKPFPWTEARAKLAADRDPAETDPLQLAEHLCSRFHLIARQCRSRHVDRPTLIVDDEYDVQDLLHSLLHIYFDDIRAEEWTPSYAGGSSRVDFLLKNEQVVIEVKKTRPKLKSRDVGDQLLIDVARYRSHPHCKRLLCFVYDPDGWIANPRGLENDLNSKTEDFEVKVIVVPKGH